jgi:hypothetical protein
LAQLERVVAQLAPFFPLAGLGLGKHVGQPLVPFAGLAFSSQAAISFINSLVQRTLWFPIFCESPTQRIAKHKVVKNIFII